MTEQQQKLPTPPGYSELVPFNRDQFKQMGKREHAPAEFAKDMNSIYITAVEFFQAARHYPIVFGKDSQTGGYVPVAITGLEKDQNLFTDDEGNWMPGTYIPAYVRRWPFFLVQVPATEERGAQNIVCVDPQGLEANDKPLVDDNGEPTDNWADIERLVTEMERARIDTQEFTKQLDELGLIESFEAHASAKGGQNMRLAGLYRINEDKLNELPEKKIKQLMKKGYLSRIYSHLISLEGFQGLLNLRLRRQQHMGEA
ncbi:MAG: SapC family protein [Gammaproteobacteria bacterium]|nr:SapC family protein [Gammaproteobacteria bacterium]